MRHPSNPVSADLIRELLKAVSPAGAGKPPAVPEPPEDPDRLDPRVEDASPTEEDVKAATAKASGTQETPDEEAGGEGKPAKAPAGGVAISGQDEEEAADTEGDETGDDTDDDEAYDPFENRDLDARTVKKALPPAEGFVGAPDQLKGMYDPESLLTALISQVGDLQVVVLDLTRQLKTFQKDQRGTRRDLQKALDASESIQEQLRTLHTTAPAAEPRALTKGLPVSQEPVQPLMTRQELMSLAGSGRLSPLEVAQINSQLQAPSH